MKKFLLSIFCYLSCFFSIRAQILFGTTFYEGSNGGGTIIKFIPSINNVEVVKSFESIEKYPGSDLFQAADGKLYGMTREGGSKGKGVIFSYDPANSVYKKLKDFDGINGANPNGKLIQASDGKLYGMTRNGGDRNFGLIFSFDLSSMMYLKLKSFDSTNGLNPQGSLTEGSDGKLYGTTAYGGTWGNGVIFSIDPTSSIFTKLKDFDYPTGSRPTDGNLIQASDGKLYGTTNQGGRTGLGVLFAFDPLTYSYLGFDVFDRFNGFQPGGSLIEASNGKLYGMTKLGGTLRNGVIYSFDPININYIKIMEFDGNNGRGANGSLVQGNDGNLYGNIGGGSNGAGLLFSLDLTTLNYTKIKDFDSTHKNSVYGSLMQTIDGIFYGTMSEGVAGYGGIFSFDPSTGTCNTPKDFGTNTEGSNVSSKLILATDGKLYGMGSQGGAYGAGVIFSFDPNTYSYLKLQDFNGTNGAIPYGSLIQGSNGILYGLTSKGGKYGSGVIFSFDPILLEYKKLKDFDNNSGSGPFGDLLQASDGKLYGMTSHGGIRGAGVIFSYDILTSVYTKLKDFDNTFRSDPYGSLVEAYDGKLYGMTSKGGNKDSGSIFSFDPVASVYMKMYDMDNSNGALPLGSFIQASDLKLYAMASKGGSKNEGVIFSFDPKSSMQVRLIDFDITNGKSPYGNLIQASDGILYGMTTYGGIIESGVIFCYNPCTSIFTKLIDLNADWGSNPSYGSGFIDVNPSTIPKMIYTLNNVTDRLNITKAP